MRSLSISFYFIIFFTNRFNGFYLCFWFLLLFSFIWIGGQFPVDNFLSYGRILTLHYYYLLICILFLFNVMSTDPRARLSSLIRARARRSSRSSPVRHSGSLRSFRRRSVPPAVKEGEKEGVTRGGETRAG